ncbi:MAG: alpha/beta fold hydrolase [Ectothiorhodospiraceae bacterium]|nr:alpha/beta fold hydrolase [Ectothiorhodospiraceae bacterium]
MYLIALVCALAALLVYLLFFFDNGFGGFRRLAVTPRQAEQRPDGRLETVYFPAEDGTRLEGWLIQPSNDAPGPLVIMAPGLTGTKDAHLEPFAWHFAARGLAVLLFDFRCFGGSDGEPRHWVDPFRHVADYRSAIDYATSDLARRGVVDPGRLVLWGSSFSGGSALVAAAQSPEVAAVVAQCPYIETPPEQVPTGRAHARYIFWTVLDLARSAVNRLLPGWCPPLYMPAFGSPGELAFASSAENPSRKDPERRGARFWQRMPEPLRGGWENKLLARFLADFDRFKPLDSINAVACPILLVAAEHDDLIPLRYIERAHEAAAPGSCELAVFPCRHFDLYLEPIQQENAENQSAFIRRAVQS